MKTTRRQKLRDSYGSAEFKARCLELVDQVKESHTEVVVTRHGRPVARLVPYDLAEPASLIGSMANTVIAFDQPFDPVPAVWSVDSAADDER